MLPYTTISGLQFKALLPGISWYKVLNSDLVDLGYVIRNGYKYTMGLNEYKIKETDVSLYSNGDIGFHSGLYFTDPKNTFIYLRPNMKLTKLEIPDDANISITPHKFVTDKLMLTKVFDDENEILNILKSAFEQNLLCNERPCVFQNISETSDHTPIYCDHGTRLCQFAASHGYLEILKWCRQNHFRFDEHVCSTAAAEGQLEILKWLRDNECPWDEWTCCDAARHGHLETLKWARENGCPWDQKYVNMCSSAAISGNLEILKWVIESGCKWDRDVFVQAAASGNLELFRWVIANLKNEKGELSWDAGVCSAAAEDGLLDILQLARQHGCPWNIWTCAYAAGNGHLKLLQWAHENGCPWDVNASACAADGWDFETIKWLHANGCPSSKDTFMSSIDSGNMEMFTWSYEHCPWSEYVLEYAALHGNFEIIKWCLERANSDGKILEWYHDKCLAAAFDGHMKRLKLAQMTGDYSSLFSNLDILVWFRKQCAEKAKTTVTL